MSLLGAMHYCLDEEKWKALLPSKYPHSSYILQPNSTSRRVPNIPDLSPMQRFQRRAPVQPMSSLYFPSYSPSCHHNNTQPVIHSWNCYWERQKGEAFDVSLQGSSLTSLSPPGELWASWDLQLCQLGCNRCSCLCARLAPGTLVGHLASICGLAQHPTSPNQNEKSISVTQNIVESK